VSPVFDNAVISLIADRLLPATVKTVPLKPNELTSVPLELYSARATSCWPLLSCPKPKRMTVLENEQLRRALQIRFPTVFFAGLGIARWYG